MDAKRVVFGHSRLGKTALWAGAQDERFALVISNNSGEGGASLARRNFGENIAYSIAHASWRYCDCFRDFIDREKDLPFDQHMLLALTQRRAEYLLRPSLGIFVFNFGLFRGGRRALSDPAGSAVFLLQGKRGALLQAP
ncbi:MAG: hypothetical protein ISS70_17410 [Phycisphaerae bacterium]|nr:hypothetical protein [Phycisphaerae bacterium]